MKCAPHCCKRFELDNEHWIREMVSYLRIRPIRRFFCSRSFSILRLRRHSIVHCVCVWWHYVLSVRRTLHNFSLLCAVFQLGFSSLLHSRVFFFAFIRYDWLRLCISNPICSVARIALPLFRFFETKNERKARARTHSLHRTVCFICFSFGRNTESAHELSQKYVQTIGFSCATATGSFGCVNTRQFITNERIEKDIKHENTSKHTTLSTTSKEHLFSHFIIFTILRLSVGASCRLF